MKTAEVRRVVRAGVVEGGGLKIVDRGVLLVVVPTPEGDVIVWRDGEWREGFETGPWVEALDDLIAGAPKGHTHADRARGREIQRATKAVNRAAKKGGPRG